MCSRLKKENYIMLSKEIKMALSSTIVTIMWSYDIHQSYVSWIIKYKIKMAMSPTTVTIMWSYDIHQSYVSWIIKYKIN